MDCAVNGAPIWAAKRLPISRAGTVKANKYRPFSEFNPAERGGNS